MSESYQKLEPFSQSQEVQSDFSTQGKMKKIVIIIGIAIFLVIAVVMIVIISTKKEEESKPKKEFQIYLAFGQSNMEGQGNIEEEDIQNIPERFKLMAAVDMPNLNRTKGNWYTAIPPLCRENTKLSVVDYFGRTMAQKLGNHVNIGLIHVAVGGCSLELFDEENCAKYIQDSPWVQEPAALYNNNTFRVLIDLAKKAQKEGGVIKGILLHQGESNSGATWWPDLLKTIYDRMIIELELKPEKIPILIGEMGRENMGGAAELHNTIIAKVPGLLTNAHIISSENITMQDVYHFDSKGYREFGRRYAEKMLSLLK